MPDSTPGIGQYQPADGASDYNYLTFVIGQSLGKVRTAFECQVVSCTNSGGVAPFGLVTVQPVVRLQDGGGYTQPHGPVYNLTYFRLQGGANAVICDPTPGDLGVAFVMDRDTSSAVANATQLQSGTPGPGNTVPPGSWRRFSMSDGFFVCGNLNATPTCYIRFAGEGKIDVVAPGGMTLNGVTIDAIGNVKSPHEVTATNNSGQTVGLTTHSTSEVTSGGDDSGPPVGNT